MMHARLGADPRRHFASSIPAMPFRASAEFDLPAEPEDEDFDDDEEEDDDSDRLQLGLDAEWR